MTTIRQYTPYQAVIFLGIKTNHSPTKINTMSVNCAIGNLDVYSPTADKAWDKKRIQHLARRMGFSINLTEINTVLNVEPATLVDNLINAAKNEPLWEAPYWSNYGWDDFEEDEIYRVAYEWMVEWVVAMEAKGFREKMVLFWSNHFVTEYDSYEFTPFLYQYHELLMTHAFGNFKDFVREVGLNPAMLIYLSGYLNTKDQPNENYARELYELFALGQNNGYTQDDIVETARALTGWLIDEDKLEVIFEEEEHDFGTKTIFGRTGNWNYDDVIDILFEERTDEIALFVCGKLYQFFVHPNINQEVVGELALTFKNANFELLPVLHQLFKSEHFFDDANMSTIIKSPADTFIGFAHEIGLLLEKIIEVDEEEGIEYAWKHFIFYGMENLGQELFQPPNVAGWPGNRAWLNSNTLTTRWQFLDWMIWHIFEEEMDSSMAMIKELCNNSNDPAVITMTIIDHFIPNGLQTPEAYQNATDRFKGDVPQSYYDNNSWNLNWEGVNYQLVLLFHHIIRQPEFLLH